MTTTNIFQAHSEKDNKIIRDLFWEYLTWANDMNDQTFGIRLDITSMLDEDMAGLAKFMPPYGRLLLSEIDGFTVGCICLKKLTVSVGEVKRLYVKPDYRGKGIGKKMVEVLLDEARRIGYRTVRLDSTRYMTKAHAVYRSFGFYDIVPYPESEIPEEFHEHWVFMENQIND
jgi:GNAT superfamily N-acetyltransferase